MDPHRRLYRSLRHKICGISHEKSLRSFARPWEFEPIALLCQRVEPRTSLASRRPPRRIQAVSGGGGGEELHGTSFQERGGASSRWSCSFRIHGDSQLPGVCREWRERIRSEERRV